MHRLRLGRSLRTGVACLAAVVCILVGNRVARASASPTLVPTASTYDASAFAVTHGWERVVAQSDGRFHGMSVRGYHPGASAAFDFWGSTFRLYGVVGPGGGLGLVTIDGHPAYIMNFYAPRKSTHLVVYESPKLTRTKHRIELKILGERTTPGRYVNLDGIDVR